MDLVEFQKQMKHRDLIISLAQPRRQRIQPILLYKPLRPRIVPDCMGRVREKFARNNELQKRDQKKARLTFTPYENH